MCWLHERVWRYRKGRIFGMMRDYGSFFGSRAAAARRFLDRAEEEVRLSVHGVILDYVT
jgi:hypothetical protein